MSLREPSFALCMLQKAQTDGALQSNAVDGSDVGHPISCGCLRLMCKRTFAGTAIRLAPFD